MENSFEILNNVFFYIKIGNAEWLFDNEDDSINHCKDHVSQPNLLILRVKLSEKYR